MRGSRYEHRSKAINGESKTESKTAKKIFKDGEVDFAGSRAYYAMFYVAEALLLQNGLSFSSHSAVTANFGKEYAHTGVLDPKFHQYLIKAQDRRNIGDYAIGTSLTKEEVTEMLAWAKEFIKTAENSLKQAFGAELVYISL